MHLWIDVNKIIKPFIYSLFLTSQSMILVERHTDFAVIMLVSLSILFITGRTLYKIKNKNESILVFIVFGVLVSLGTILTADVHTEAIRYISIFFMNTVSTVALIIAIYRIFNLSSSCNKMYQYYSRYINFNNFSPNFKVPALIMFGYMFMFYSMALASAYYIPLILAVGLLYIFTYFMNLIFNKCLYKYKDAFYVICSSDKRFIKAEQLSREQGDSLYRWYSLKIAPYVNHSKYDINKHTITFADIDELEQNNKTEERETLEQAVNTIDSYIEKLDDNEEIKITASNIKNELVKIDNFHKNEYKFNKHIRNINERYMPYIEKLITAYMSNKELPNEITKDMQGKIILSLNQIYSVLKETLEKMYNRNMMDLESHMEAFNIVLSQSGFKAGNTGDK